MIKIILFDLGGVLVELTGVPTMLKWTRNKYDVEKLWEAWLSSPAVRAFETGATTTEQFADQIIREMKLPVGKHEFTDRFRNWPKGLFPGVPNLLNRLKSNYILACFSNSNMLHWPILMNDMGIETMFRYHFASHQMGMVKPDKQAFGYVLNGLGCSPASVLFLDDNIVNVKSATALGMVAYRVRGLKETEQVLSKIGILKPNGTAVRCHDMGDDDPAATFG